MATAETLSPTSEGRCLLQQPNSGGVSEPHGCLSLQQAGNIEVGFKSAPESFEIEAQEQDQNNSGRQWRGRRRKRRNSLSEHPSAGQPNQNGKRRRGNGNHHKRQLNSARRIILPNKFLLGGNIADPLNLNSMMDEKVNEALNAVTPSSSPLPPRNSTIDIVLPSDVTDPLGLNSTNFDKPTKMREALRSKNKRKRRRKSQAAKQERQHNSDTASNSDDQKQNLVDISSANQNEAEQNVPPGEAVATSVVENRNQVNPKIKQNSPDKSVSRITITVPQASVKDPIVSPVVPQDTRRFRASFGAKNRRRKHGGGKPMMSDAGIQTESAELQDDLRCRSEKNWKRDFFSPVKRRRTVSENFMRASYWEEEESKVKIHSFFKEPLTVPSVRELKATSSLLSHSLYGKVAKSTAAETGDGENDGKSPAHKYMNKEMNSEEGPKNPEQNNKSKSTENRGRFDNRGSTRKNGDSCVKRKDKANGKGQRPQFQYGNYNKYYGYRNPEKFKDVRMENLKKDWFRDKDVLDIGCNAGHLTLLIARSYEPRKIVGIDIDDGLIRTARNNIRHYASVGKASTARFPASMAISLGPLACPPIETGKDETTAAFPNNVNFFQGNYVPQKDEFLRFQEPEYDVIMCMSVSKWIHLNWGDEGLIRMFRRVFKQLRAGGMFILEPQQWDSYKSKRRLTPQLNENFQSIRLMPQSFPSFLVRDIGFERVEHLTSQKKGKASGFQRPIQVYFKPE